MAFDEVLAARIRRRLDGTPGVAELRMMGALVFCVNGHMCCGVTGGGLMVRLGEAGSAAALNRPHVRPLEIGGGRAPRAFVCVAGEGVGDEAALGAWIDAALAFNSRLKPKAASVRVRAVGRSQGKQ